MFSHTIAKARAVAKATPGSLAATVLLGVIAIVAPAMAAEYISRTLGTGFGQDWFASGVVMMSGYLGSALFLLRHRSSVRLWTRVRLGLSTLMPVGVLVIAAAQQMHPDAYGFLLVAGVLVCVPLLYVGANQIAHDGIWAKTDDNPWAAEHPTVPIFSMNWSVVCIALALTLVPALLSLGVVAKALGSIVLLIAGAELLVLPRLIMLFVFGAFEEMGTMLTSGAYSAGSTSHKEPSDPYDYEELWGRRTGISDSQDINPATGFPMVGGVDIAGNAYGEDRSESHWPGGLYSGGTDLADSTYGSGMNDYSSSGFDDHSSSFDSYSSSFD